MAQIKSNLAPIGDSVVFRIKGDAPIEWVRKSRITAEELIEQTTDNVSKEQRAESIIYQLLKNGEKPSKQILTECENNGISNRTVKTAKAKMNIVTTKKKDGWYWSLATTSTKEKAKEYWDGD